MRISYAQVWSQEAKSSRFYVEIYIDMYVGNLSRIGVVGRHGETSLPISTRILGNIMNGSKVDYGYISLPNNIGSPLVTLLNFASHD